ncbi:MAG TPA: Ppx/GppA family phosphatase, partial [Deltaproteobacteria bacterium]|nr:Ppx/GppA family phosphatase [Deltaproteobacteria bacterium]
ARLDRAHLSGFIERLLPMDRDERRALVAIDPDRADYLLAGIHILDRILAMAGCEALIVSVRGLRYGLLAADRAC